MVATLDGDDDASDDLGSLRVGLLARQGPALKVVASNENVNEADLKRAIEPSRAEVRIDPAAFRIGPHEVAVAVDVSETLTTTSTLAEASTLFLYRRGRREAPSNLLRADGRDHARQDCWWAGDDEALDRALHAAHDARLLRSCCGTARREGRPDLPVERDALRCSAALNRAEGLPAPTPQG